MFCYGLLIHGSEDPNIDITTKAGGIGEDVEIAMKIVPVVVLTSIITVVITVSFCLGCWCYHLKKRKRDLTTKGGLIVLSEDLKRASSEGRLVVNISLLDHTKVMILVKVPTLAKKFL